MKKLDGRSRWGSDFASFNASNIFSWKHMKNHKVLRIVNKIIKQIIIKLVDSNSLQNSKIGITVVMCDKIMIIMHMIKHILF